MVAVTRLASPPETGYSALNISSYSKRAPTPSTSCFNSRLESLEKDSRWRALWPVTKPHPLTDGGRIQPRALCPIRSYSEHVSSCKMDVCGLDTMRVSFSSRGPTTVTCYLLTSKPLTDTCQSINSLSPLYIYCFSSPRDVSLSSFLAMRREK